MSTERLTDPYDLPELEEPMAIIAYKQLLLKLNKLCKDGLGDTDEADTLRDEMDDHWYKMSEESQKYIAEISAKLQNDEKPDLSLFDDIDSFEEGSE